MAWCITCDRGAQYRSTRYGQALSDCEAVASVGSKGDSFRLRSGRSTQAPLCKAELICNRDPWEDIDAASARPLDAAAALIELAGRQGHDVEGIYDRPGLGQFLAGGALVAAMEFKSQRGPSFGNNFNNRTEETLRLTADSQMAVERDLFGRLKPWFGFVVLVERAKGSLGAVRVPSNMPFPADTIFNSASYIDRYRIFFERMVTEGNYDAVALLTAEAESAEYVEPSASLSLANLEAAIRARIAYIKALPDDVFDELTAS